MQVGGQLKRGQGTVCTSLCARCLGCRACSCGVRGDQGPADPPVRPNSCIIDLYVWFVRHLRVEHDPPITRKGDQVSQPPYGLPGFESPSRQNAPARRRGGPRPLWEILVALIGAIGTVVAAVLGAVIVSGGGGTTLESSLPGSASPSPANPSPANPSTSSTASGEEFSDSGYSQDLRFNQGIGIAGIIDGGTTTIDLGVGDIYSRLLLQTVNGAYIVDMGSKPPMPNDCKMALLRKVTRVIPHDKEFYCIQTMQGNIVKLEVITVYLMNNAVDYIALMVWPLAPRG